MLYSIIKKSGPRNEIMNIRAKYSKKSRYYSRGSSSDDTESNSSQGIYSIRDTHRSPDGCKVMNILDHLVTRNLKTNKYQSNEAIDNKTSSNNSKFNLSCGTSDPLPVVTVYL